jgi:aspartate kinase
MKVLKFGGAILKDEETFLQVAETIISYLPQKIVVVLSALKGVTDSLFQVLKKAERDEKVIPPFIRRIKRLHRKIALKTISEPGILKETLEELGVKISQLERVLYGVAYTEEVTEKNRDFLVSFGERLSCLVLSGLLRSRGVNSRVFEADKIGLLTDGLFGRATPILPLAEKNLKKNILPQVKQGVIPVITGYFGCDRQGRTTTFGRGGTDYSAAILAYALGAEVLEVWKDVPGFMSADPKLIKEAREITLLSYEEAAELAYFGAKILHPRIVEPVEMKNIPIRVRSIFAPRRKGSLISRVSQKGGGAIRSVAVKSGLSLITLSGAAMAYTPGLASKVFAALSSGGVNVYTMGTSMSSFSLIIEAPDVKKALKSLNKIKDGIVKDVRITKGISLVCLAGRGLRKTKGLAARTFRAIARAGVNVELISDGGSDIALNFVIKSGDEDKAARALHKEFFKRGGTL